MAAALLCLQRIIDEDSIVASGWLGVFLAALWYIVRPAWRRLAALAAIAGAVPLAYQVFRMGYYGLLVPNTAVAKDASSTRFHQGFVYLADFASPYRLWIALLVLLGCSLLLYLPPTVFRLF